MEARFVVVAGAQPEAGPSPPDGASRSKGQKDPSISYRDEKDLSIRRTNPVPVASAASLAEPHPLHHFPFCHEDHPGSWKGAIDWATGRWGGVLRCCRCGQAQAMGFRTHSIHSDGTLGPSFVCMNPECDFHGFVRVTEIDA